MSSVASSTERGSDAKLAVRCTRASTSATLHSSIAHIATMCWASTSTRVGRDAQRLDGPGAHPLDDDRGLHEVAAELREEDALADRADLVARATHALEAARDARRALDLDDEVDGAHVDAELETARRDDGRQPPGLEVLLDGGAVLLAHRAVVGAREDRRRRRGWHPTGP